MSDQVRQTEHLTECDWQRKIREACLERGWDDGELARRAGVSRSTLYYLRQGTTQRPRASTLNGIAQALQIDPRSLCSRSDDAVEATEHSAGYLGESCEAERRFDRRTNPLVDVVHRDHPEIFDGWNQVDWDELYSVFGTGGRLTEEGVTEAAQQMNRRQRPVNGR